MQLTIRQWMPFYSATDFSMARWEDASPTACFLALFGPTFSRGANFLVLLAIARLTGYVKCLVLRQRLDFGL